MCYPKKRNKNPGDEVDPVFMILSFLCSFQWSQVSASPLLPLTKPCLHPGVGHITLPLNPGDPNSKSFTYQYLLLPAPKKEAPTILVVPGGPGGTSIDEAQ